MVVGPEFQPAVDRMKLAIAARREEFAGSEPDDHAKLMRAFSLAIGVSEEEVRDALHPGNYDENPLQMEKKQSIRNKFTWYLEKVHPILGSYDLPKVTASEAKQTVEAKVTQYLPGFGLLEMKQGKRRFDFAIGSLDHSSPIRFELVWETSPIASVRAQVRIGLGIIGQVSVIFSDYRRAQVVQKDDFYYWTDEWLRYCGLLRSYLMRQPELSE
ncbi:hypothetical protein SAMN05421665_0249 [Yoonia rosea]|uniref:Uncharacterized protein n=1 Tax=Yoonia rosea TaxID=287098 RepID=A0A1R3WCZ2_9RHOB|nr:hypothetical protein [Yoonia rosea]SIT75746.1 hypothetical protein SAMN05421665_0249 [Yoonia rosea]